MFDACGLNAAQEFGNEWLAGLMLIPRVMVMRLLCDIIKARLDVSLFYQPCTTEFFSDLVLSCAAIGSGYVSLMPSATSNKHLRFSISSFHCPENLVHS